MSIGNADSPESLGRIPKVSEVLAERLRARIFGEGLQPGDALSSEPELIARYGVARATVREALRLLEADGLIEIRRGRGGGNIVREPDLAHSTRAIAFMLTMRQSTLRTLFDFRLLIEPAAARAAAHSSTIDERNQLVALADDKWQPNLGPSVDFHNAIGAYSHNDLVQVSIATMAHEFSWHAPGEGLAPSEAAKTIRAHRAIAHAIRDGDGERAHQAMCRHIEGFRTLLDRAGRLDEPIVPRGRWLSNS
jgi:GntR family transcriptional repressor for pyruvate dehydrogenase complex